MAGEQADNARSKALSAAHHHHQQQEGGGSSTAGGRGQQLLADLDGGGAPESLGLSLIRKMDPRSLARGGDSISQADGYDGDGQGS